MCPKQIERFSKTHSGRRVSNRAAPRPFLEQGFLMPMALFIVIGLGTLALAMSRMGAGSLSAAVQESLSAQAFYAAESGAQYGMHALLFDTADRAQADTRCTSLAGSVLNFSTRGLAACSAAIDCSAISNTGPVRVYQIESAASCGSGDFLSQRTVAVAATYK